MAYPSASHIAAQAGGFEAQLTNRFQVEVYGLDSGDSDIILLSLSGFTPPELTIEAVKIKYGNESRSQAGEVAFGDATLKVHDYVDAKVREAMYRWIKKVYDARTGLMGYARDYKKTGALIMTGPDGQSTRQYDLVGLWPKGVSPGEFSMESGDAIILDFPICCDVATYADI